MILQLVGAIYARAKETICQLLSVFQITAVSAFLIQDLCWLCFQQASSIGHSESRATELSNERRIFCNFTTAPHVNHALRLRSSTEVGKRRSKPQNQSSLITPLSYTYEMKNENF